MSNFIEEGAFTLYYGPMKSGKTKSLIDHMDFLTYTDGIEYSFFKPSSDDRDEAIVSRFSEKSYEPIVIDAKNPKLILNHINGQKIVAIDEIQFFGLGIVQVVEELQRRGIHVVASGLNLDFKGDVFTHMGSLLGMCTDPRYLTAVCEHDGCNHKATRTQRLVNGEPASRTAPQELIEGSEDEIEYQARCLKHHIVAD